MAGIERDDPLRRTIDYTGDYKVYPTQILTVEALFAISRLRAEPVEDRINFTESVRLTMIERHPEDSDYVNYVNQRFTPTMLRVLGVVPPAKKDPGLRRN